MCVGWFVCVAVSVCECGGWPGHGLCVLMQSADDVCVLMQSADNVCG